MSSLHGLTHLNLREGSFPSLVAQWMVDSVIMPIVSARQVAPRPALPHRHSRLAGHHLVCQQINKKCLELGLPLIQFSEMF